MQTHYVRMSNKLHDGYFSLNLHKGYEEIKFLKACRESQLKKWSEQKDSIFTHAALTSEAKRE